MALTRDSFAEDRHAATYLPELDARPEATEHLLGLLNEPVNERRLVDAQDLGLPALAGVVRFLEADPAISAVLDSGSAGYRFRQAVGVAVKLKMSELGWTTTTRKGSIRALHFTKAERFERVVHTTPVGG